jgi:hypothetical protein
MPIFDKLPYSLRSQGDYVFVHACIKIHTTKRKNLIKFCSCGVFLNFEEDLGKEKKFKIPQEK